MYVCGVNGVCVCVWYMVYGSMRVHVVNGVCGVCILCVYVCLVNGVCVWYMVCSSMCVCMCGEWCRECACACTCTVYVM